MYDLIITNGTLVDGTGAQARRADIAILDGKIVAVGAIEGEAREVIDAKGMLVTPGFVDMHSHYDAQVTWDPYMTPSSWHGCTTVVMGSCGVGFAPAAPDKHDWLIGLMEGVEDIPGAALHEGIKWGWETFPEYLDAIEAVPHAIDFAAQVPHGPLRAYVMGERAEGGDATDEDVRRMAAIVKEAIAAGAVGFSTSRTMLHKSIDGIPVPGTFATTKELFGIGRALGEVGTGVFQTATDHLNVPMEFDWFKALAAEIDRPVIFNLSQTDQAPGLWRQLVTRLEEAHAEGLRVYGQVAGRAIGIMMSWQATAHPFAAYPTVMGLSGLPWPEQLEKLKDPDVRAQILSEKPVDLWAFADMITRTFTKMFPLGDKGINYEPEASDSIAALASQSGRTPQEIAYDAMMANDGQGMLYFPLFNYADENLDALHTLHSHPLTRMGLSDAGAHCGAICDGGMPTFMLTHWTRDRTRGPRIPLEHIIKRQTMDTARTYGFYDRGTIEVGMKADVNIIDYDNLRFMQPEMVFDLPADGRRLVQRAEGYVATICSGEVIMRNGEPTGAMPGRLVRGEQHLQEAGTEQAA